jgi:hypothetical protein
MEDEMPRKPLLIFLLVGLAVAALPGVARAAGTSYYVDCGRATNGNGTQAVPWNSLSTVSTFAFMPGDQVLFQRGSTCSGALLFGRAGTVGNPITIDAFGTGAPPIIDGTGQQTAVKLSNPSYVTVQNLEIKNSQRWGLLATTTTATVSTGLTLRNLDVHDVSGSTMDQKYTGLVTVMPGVSNSRFDRVEIDSIHAHNTTMWAGIIVWGIWIDGDRQWAKKAKDPSLRSTNVTIRNSSVHDTYGDGIVTYMGNGVLMERNIAYRTGIQPTETIGTPNAIWTWASNNVVVQYNEAYDNNSPGADGGAFDIDYWSDNTTVQFNYAHDNSAYCVGIFGAENSTTTNSIVRYNVCANNGFETSRDGAEEIYLATWNNGKLANVQIYGNTIYATRRGAVGTLSTIPAPTFAVGTTLTFKNNLVVSTTQNTLGNGMGVMPFQRDYNLYYSTAGSISSGEAHSVHNVDPLVNALGYHGIGRPTTQWTLQSASPAIDRGTVIAGAPGSDFFGGPAPLGPAPDIGADEAR